MLMTTHSGRRVDLADIRPEHIIIEDVAHALAHICRFGGHTKVFYSVAQHSVRVARSVPREFMLEGLLHDATEAFVGDMVRPLKRMLPEYKGLEEAIYSAIALRYDLPLEMSPCVKRGDEASLKSELKQFMNGADELGHDYWRNIEALPAAERAWEPIIAKSQFLLAFTEAIAIRRDVKPRTLGH
jgi:5'-deoxynucleotidase YfbR-like HD superfamily hydrolase